MKKVKLTITLLCVFFCISAAFADKSKSDFKINSENSYFAAVDVTFQVDMTGYNVDLGVYIVGDATAWAFVSMAHLGNNIYSVTLQLEEGTQGAYYFIRNNSWDNYQQYRETVPSECAVWWGSDRGYVVPNVGTTLPHVFSSCETTLGVDLMVKAEIALYPNPVHETLEIKMKENQLIKEVELMDVSGKLVLNTVVENKSELQLDLRRFNSGTYFLTVQTDVGVLSKKIIIK